MTDIQKECMICSQSLASQQCKVCGRLVCNTHFDSSNQVCSDCLSRQAS